jgi:hypothetical protein
VTVTRIKAPTKGDKRMLRYVLDKLHVSASDAAVEELVRSRLSAAVARSKGKIEVREPVVRAWVRAAWRSTTPTATCTARLSRGTSCEVP